MFRISLPSDFKCPARSWKFNSATEAEAIVRSIDWINYWNQSNITELPKGTVLVEYEVIA